MAVGWNNSFLTHPLGKKLGYFAESRHSELSAYLKLQDKSLIPYLTAANVRISKTGVVNLSYPCECCLPFMKSLGFRKLYYTNELGGFSRAW